MPATYEPISSTTLNSDIAQIDFNSIPSSYTDLRMVIFADFSGTDATIRARLNNNTNSIYYYTILRGAGSGSGTSESGNSNYLYINGQTQSNGYTYMFTVDIFQYTKSNIAKQIISAGYRNAAPFGGDLNININRYDDNSAISSIQLFANGFNSSGRFTTGTTATLFGIKGA